MFYEVVWRKVANRQFQKIFDRLVANFGQTIAARFYRRTMEHVSLLVTNPYLGVHTPEYDTATRQYLSILIHKHIRLFYYVGKREVYVVAFMDTRRKGDKSNP